MGKSAEAKCEFACSVTQTQVLFSFRWSNGWAFCRRAACVSDGGEGRQPADVYCPSSCPWMSGLRSCSRTRGCQPSDFSVPMQVGVTNGFVSRSGSCHFWALSCNKKGNVLPWPFPPFPGGDRAHGSPHLAPQGSVSRWARRSCPSGPGLLSFGQYRDSKINVSVAVTTPPVGLLN